LLNGFKDKGEAWIVMDVQEAWPEGVYVDEESADEAVRQLQVENPDGFYRVVYSGLDEFVGIDDVEEDNWL
jgi:hypothetical protein